MNTETKRKITNTKEITYFLNKITDENTYTPSSADQKKHQLVFTIIDKKQNNKYRSTILFRDKDMDELSTKVDLYYEGYTKNSQQFLCSTDGENTKIASLFKTENEYTFLIPKQNKETVAVQLDRKQFEELKDIIDEYKKQNGLKTYKN